MFETYNAASLKERYELLKDRDFCLTRYHWIIQSLEGERAESIRRLSDHLCNTGSFLSAPASSKRKYHLAVESGLLRHSIWVSDCFLDLLRFYGVPMDYTSARLVSLFHDASKAGIGGLTPDDGYQPRYLPTTPEEWRRSSEPYRYNPELTHLFLPVASLWLVSSFVQLTAKEAQVIVSHDSLYCLENRSYAHRQCPEAVILAQADEASLIYERELLE